MSGLAGSTEATQCVRPRLRPVHDAVAVAGRARLGVQADVDWHVI